MTVNFERAALLFDIIEGVAKVAPGYTNLSSEAMVELKQMNDEIANRKKPVNPQPAKVLSENPEPTKPVVPITSEKNSPESEPKADGSIERRI